MQNILFWLTEKYYLIECRVGNFINLRKGNRIKTLPQKRMKKIALRQLEPRNAESLYLCGLPAFVLSNGSSLALFVGGIRVAKALMEK